MERYIITSTKFNGKIIVGFNDKGVINHIDLSTADLDATLTAKFLRSIPLLDTGLSEAFSKETTVVAENYIVTFADFWEAYDKKINKARCIPLWNKLNHSQQVTAFYGVRKYDEFLRKTTRIKCDPENYLRNQMWENEWK